MKAFVYIRISCLDRLRGYRRIALFILLFLFVFICCCVYLFYHLFVFLCFDDRFSGFIILFVLLNDFPFVFVLKFLGILNRFISYWVTDVFIWFKSLRFIIFFGFSFPYFAFVYKFNSSLLIFVSTALFSPWFLLPFISFIYYFTFIYFFCFPRFTFYSYMF